MAEDYQSETGWQEREAAVGYAVAMQYASAWRDRRRRFLALLAVLAAWGPLLYAARRVESSTATAAICTAVALVVVAALRIALFKCPRCGKNFHHDRSRFSHCNHCDLRAWEGERRFL